jgi:hypothetical protein
MYGHTHWLGYTSHDRNRLFGMLVVVHCTSLSPSHGYGFFGRSVFAAVNVHFLLVAHGLNPNLKEMVAICKNASSGAEEVLAYPSGFRTCHLYLPANSDRTQEH